MIQRDDPDTQEEIGGMPGIYRYGVNRLDEHLKPAIAAGLSSVLLFGVPFSMPKDVRGSAADHPQTPVILAIQKLRSLFPNLVIACDVSFPFLCSKFKFYSGKLALRIRSILAR